MDDSDNRRNNGENNRSKTHCPQGHPLKGKNLLTADLKRGKRGCKTCHYERKNEYRRRLRDAK